jgi:hypothetical protein
MFVAESTNACKIVMANTTVAINSWNPRKELNRLNCIVANRIRQTMTGRRKSPDAVIHIPVSKGLLPVWCHFLVAAGFVDMTDESAQNKAEYANFKRMFSTSSFAVLSNAFDCLPNGADPFENCTMMTSPNMFKLSKEVNNKKNAPLVMNIRNAKVADIRISAEHELNITEADAKLMSKKELVEKILQQRIAEKTYIGLLSVFRIVVDEDHPFKVCVRLGCAHAVIRLSFRVTKDDVVLMKGQLPFLTNKY